LRERLIDWLIRYLLDALRRGLLKCAHHLQILHQAFKKQTNIEMYNKNVSYNKIRRKKLMKNKREKESNYDTCNRKLDNYQ